MKFAVAFAALLAVASAALHKPVDSSMAELEAIIAAIQSPSTQGSETGFCKKPVPIPASTDSATAAMLEQQLADLLADFIPQPEPVLVEEPAPISIGPAIIDFPVPDGGAVTAEEPAIVESPAVMPAPAVVPEAAAPLVQIILNINQANSAAAAPVAPAPVETPVIDVHPVQVVDEAVNEDTIVPSPVVVVDTVPEPVQVVDVVAPEAEPIQIGTPIIPVPVVTLPDILN